MSDLSTLNLPRPVAVILDWYERIIRFAGGSLMAIIVVVMIAQVIARYIFNSSFIWAEELCRYLLIWKTFLLLGMVYQTGGFVALDMLPMMLSKQSRRMLKLIVAVPMLWFLALMTWYGWIYAFKFGRQTIPAVDFIADALFGQPAGISITAVYISVSIGSGLLALHILFDFCATLIALLRNAPEEEPKPIAVGEE